MKTIKTSLLLCLCVLFIQSCKKSEQWQQDLLDSKRATTLYSISYGTDNRNQMDIALPKNRTTNTPVVVLIHGGAWVMGSRTYFSTDIQKYSDAGIACATINYRYASPRHNISNDEMVDDIRKAIDFIVSKSEEWQVSPERFGVAGHSAGGHLALMTTYTRNEDHRIKACVSWAGLVDLMDSDQRSIACADELFTYFTGHHFDAESPNEDYERVSPYWVVNSSSAPTMLIHGSLDPGVPYSNAQKMKKKLDDLGVPNDTHFMDGAFHIWTGQHLKEARSATMEWFQAKL